MTAAPWGYRILLPALARLLPGESIVNFQVLAIVTLALAGGMVALMSSVQRRETPRFTGVLLLFWGSSYALVYSGTTFVRADPLLLLFISVFYVSANYSLSLLSLWVILATGVLAHEMVLIVLPAIWLDRLFAGEFTGGKHYCITGLLGLSIGGMVWLIVTRMVIPVDGTVEPYWATPVEMARYAVAYSGGWGKHILRIYASYGPAILFAAAYVVGTRKRTIVLPFAGLLAAVFVLSFMATDTLRVLSIVYLPVLYYAAKYVETLWLSARTIQAVFCIGIQVAYSMLVFGHLRTFENSAAMNVLAAVLSVVAAIVCLDVALKLFGLSKCQSSLLTLPERADKDSP